MQVQKICKTVATFIVLSVAMIGASLALASSNIINDSFNKAKRMLEQKVYYDHRVTFYCQASFDAKRNIDLPEGFTTPKHEKRALRMEWEHVVPAENFGQAFKEWREGHEDCMSKGKPFKGRRCAEKVNMTFRYMQADLYNLYPAIGAVNAMRSNYRFSMLPGVANTFGTCEMKISGNRVEPPAYTRGAIARTHLYMADAYRPEYRLSSQQRQLMEAWNRMYPVDQWECIRAWRIEQLQKNENSFVARPCRYKGWYGGQ